MWQINWRRILKNPLDDVMCWWFDEMVRHWITWYFFPYYIAGKSDEWTQLGITLNGAKPICRP